MIFSKGSESNKAQLNFLLSQEQPDGEPHAGTNGNGPKDGGLEISPIHFMWSQLKKKKGENIKQYTKQNV
jgi:hypothetical protein